MFISNALLRAVKVTDRRKDLNDTALHTAHFGYQPRHVSHVSETILMVSENST